MRIKRNKALCGMGIAAVAALVFIFFFQWYPYHLMHREQTSLFLCDTDAIYTYFHKPAWLTEMCGDYLTQFFYYIGAGPAIMAVTMAAIWWLSILSLRRIASDAVSAALGTLFVIWCVMRELDTDSSLAGSLAILLPLLLFLAYPKIRRKKYRVVIGVALSALCYWCCGYGVWVLLALCMAFELRCREYTSSALYAILAIAAAFLPIQSMKWYGKPNLYLERQLAIDSEAYFNNWPRVQELTEGNTESAMDVFYANLANSMLSEFPERLQLNPQSPIQALFLPVNPESNYLSIGASGEMWYRAGDMTMAEHATILGMIFSPKSTGTRYLKRLAEINLINGDDAAAMKYLRMLGKTSCHSSWAEKRMPGKQSEDIRKWLDEKRGFIPKSDTLRLSSDPITGLRELLVSNPANRIAYDYLLTAHLLKKNIKGFMADFRKDMHMPRIYHEALLIGLNAQGATPEQAASYNIPEAVLNDYMAYLNAYTRCGGDADALRPQFGNSYWYYFHFAK